MKSRRIIVMFSLALIVLVAQRPDAWASIRSVISSPDLQQDVVRKITGVVKDTNGQPVVGATITSLKGDKYSVSDLDGNFFIENALSGEEYQVMCLGYQEVAFKVSSNDTYPVVLKEDNLALDEVVVVGYGTQKKASVTGSVASIGSDDIVKTKNSNIQNMLTGRVPGLRVVQRTSEPGSFDTNFDIRGFGSPLIIIDGIPRNTMTRLDPNEVESVSVLKDAAAAVYGVQAANGVVLITTKSGTNDGKVSVEYNGNMTWQMTSGLPSTVGVVDYMKMMNEKSMTSVDGVGTLYFPFEEIEKYENGEKQSTDWYRSLIREFVPQTQHNVSVSGGNKRVSFYTNIGYQYQEGFFTYGTLNYDRFNLKAKISANITDNLKFDLNLSGIADKKYSPRMSSSQIIRALWKQFPTDPIYANNNENYYYQVTVDEGINPLAMLNTDYTGYNQDMNKWFQSSASLVYDIPFIPGLSLKGLYAYDYNVTDSKIYKKSYNLYSYDSLSDKYLSTTKDAPSSVRRGYSNGSKNMYQLSVEYKNTFNDTHNVSGLLLYEGTKNTGDNFYALRELSLEVEHLFAGNAENQIGFMDIDGLYEDAQIGLIGRFNYDYQGKYLAEFLFRYDGSSRFDKSHRFGFFPSGSIGYRISEESFWKNSPLNFINNFKVRASYGIMGDDEALRYQFLTGYSYPSDFIFFGGKLVNGVSNLGIPNRNITWYTAHTMNIGVDAEAWQGMLGITFDFFQRKRTGLLGTRIATLPGVVGATLPQENLNSDKNLGLELEVSHKNSVNKDFYYCIKTNFAVTRTMTLYKEETLQRSTWHYWRNSLSNRYQNIWWGIEAGGQYQNFDEIAEFPIKTLRSDLPGDYYYEDWNGDGFINELDEHPIGFDSTPLLNYGLSVDIVYKGFDLGILFQGAAMSNIAYTESLSNAMQNIFPALDYFADRWRPAEEGADPYKYSTTWIEGRYPSVGGAKVVENSEFNVHNASYLRLKNIELGYTLPDKWMQKAKISSLRLFVSGYNILTFSGIKFVDPEHPNDNNGYMYPLNKTISLGLNLKF